MCCTTTHLGKGARCAPPLHPPGRGSFRALNPFQSQKIVSPINHSRETSLSLHPSILSGRSVAIAPPEPTRRAWRRASPPAPNHARTSGRPITNQGSVPAPTDTPMTISWRRLHRDQEGSFRATLSLEPSNRAGAFVPLASLTNPARIGCRHLIEGGSRSMGVSSPTEPYLSDLGNCLPTDTEPCTN